MSMSAFQNTAPFLPHTGTVAEASSSVRYLPLESCEQPFTLASRSAALTVPSRTDVGEGAPVAVAGSTPAVSRAAEQATERVSGRIRTVGDPSVRKVSLPGETKVPALH